MATFSSQGNPESETADVVGLTEGTKDVPESSVHWQTTKGTVRGRTAVLFNNSLMSDIKFMPTDSEGTQVRVPAHKLVLAISSPVFEAMFYGGLAETRGEIALPDTEPPFLPEFLRFLYCDEVRLTTDNAFGVLYLAQKYIVPSLADKCWDFIDNNTCACLKSNKAVSTFHNDMLGSLVQRETLHIAKELELFQATKHWAEAKLKEEEIEPSSEEVRKILGEAIHSIRFPTISPEDLGRHVVSSGLLTNNEVADLYKYFYRVKTAHELKFPVTHRAWMVSHAQQIECCRSPSARCETLKWGEPILDRLNESLSITVEPKNVLLKGFHILTTDRRGEFFIATVHLLNEDGEEMAVKTGAKYSADAHAKVGELDTYGIIVELNNPVLIWKSSKYTVNITLECYYSPLRSVYPFKSKQLEFAHVSDLCFRLEATSHTIHKLFLCKLD